MEVIHLMTYCSTPNILTRLNSLSSSISASLLVLAVEDADDWINSNIIESQLPATTPQSVVKAAELYASATILHSLYSTDEVESPIAVRLENRAKDMLDRYVNSNTAAAEVHPYSSSRTPNDSYIERDEDYVIEEESEDIRDVLDGESDAWTPS